MDRNQALPVGDHVSVREAPGRHRLADVVALITGSVGVRGGKKGEGGG